METFARFKLLFSLGDSPSSDLGSALVMSQPEKVAASAARENTRLSLSLTV